MQFSFTQNKPEWYRASPDLLKFLEEKEGINLDIANPGQAVYCARINFCDILGEVSANFFTLSHAFAKALTGKPKLNANKVEWNHDQDWDTNELSPDLQSLVSAFFGDDAYVVECLDDYGKISLLFFSEDLMDRLKITKPKQYEDFLAEVKKINTNNTPAGMD